MPVHKPKKGNRGRDALRPGAAGRRAAVDRVEEARAGRAAAGPAAGLAEVLGAGKVLGRTADLVAYASDASPYRFVPHAVVVPDSVQDIVKLMAYARRERRNLVFRAAGTSLHGQAQGEDILVDVRRHFSGAEVEADGARLRALPGTVLARANAALARHGRRLGPDPAAAAAATIGGVLADNATGTAAGTARDSYRTVASLTVVLPSGTVVDTGDPEADAALAASEPELHQGLLDLRDEIEADAALTARIRAKHALGCGVGYRLDAFLDGETPAQILRGLMIGSQGTLGFVAEAVYETLPIRPAAAAALLCFPSPAAAAAAVPLFTHAGAEAVELMDRQALAACATTPGAPARWAQTPAGCAALLVEFRAADDTELAAYERAARRICDDLGLIDPAPAAGPGAAAPARTPGHNDFTRDPDRITALWRARTSLAAAVAVTRPPGTTLVTEGFTVPQDRLAEAYGELLALQRRHGFETAVAGHAAHGSLHVLLAIDTAHPADVQRYAAFADELRHLVTERFDGSPGTGQGGGRALAPHLEPAWGATATALMWRVKRLLDPDGILAPRVVLDQDPRGHVRGLKTQPVTGTAADACTECGLCEPVCPSRDLTTTPRQRIVLRREMQRQPDGSPVLAELLDAYGHDAVDTCAGESLCAPACPVGIDTGALMREFRRARRSRAEQRAAASLAVHGRVAERVARTALAAAAAGLARTISGRLPVAPAAAPRLPRTGRQGAAAVYYPSCVNRIAGPSPRTGAGGWTPRALVALAERAGSPLWIPPDTAGTCCSGVWHAQGYDQGSAVMANRVVERAWGWTGGGRIPLVVDSGSCALGLGRDVVPYLTEANRALHAELTVVDAVVWAAEQLLPKLTVTRRAGAAVLHPACSTGPADGAFAALAAACAEEVVVPGDAGCCGFAGDRGMLRPDLAAAATRREAEEVAARRYDLHLSANRFCEMGMAHATGEPYESVFAALERATRA
jgi:D-lactate dehydrogenase